MKSALHAHALTLLFALAAAAPAQDGAPRDGGFLQTDVVAGAKWYLHLDLVRLKGSGTGAQLLAKMDDGAARKIKAFERMISFNPLEDLDAVTVSGTAAEPERAVVSVRGVFDTAHLTDLARAAKGHAETSHGDHTIHSWDDEKTVGQRIYACLLSEGAMLFGPDLELLKAVIDARRPGSAPAAPAFPPLPGRTPPFASAWADFSVLDGLEIESDFVRRVRAAHFSAGEDNGRAFARATVDAADRRAPQLMAKIAGGALSLAEAAGKIPPAIADSITIGTENKRLVIDGAMPLESLVDLIENIGELKDQL